MNDTIVQPSATTVMRAWFARMWSEPESRSTLVGVGGVLLFFLFWMLAWIIDPPLFHYDAAAMAEAARARERDFSIELTPDMFTKQPPAPPPSKFVETNPEAPENTPDKTNNFGAQNQQVAQEKPTPDGKSDRPATEGKKDFESTQIVSGSLTQPREQLPPAPQVPEQQVAETPVAAPKAEKNPLAGDEKFEGENQNGFAGNKAKRVENMTNVPEKQEGARTTQDNEGPSMMPAIDPRRPRPRPTITKQQQVRSAILAENKIGTANVGVIAHTALRTTYGEYLQQLIDTVDIKWKDICDNFRAFPIVGSRVVVKFTLNSTGKVVNVSVEETTANEVGTRACVSAITEPNPYKPWTEDMKTILGDQTELVFIFHYQ